VDRGKAGTKRSLLTEAAGIPVGLAIGGANRNDHLLVGQTLTCLPVARPEPTEERPQGLCLDKGYDLAMTSTASAPCWRSSGSRCTCGRGGRRRRRSSGRRATRLAGGWWSGRTVG
jgi:putative transposase